jgi:LPXTG-motif cell wall-anchored protein
MGILTRGRLGLLSLVILIVGLVFTPAAVADSTACAGDYDVTIEALLLNPNGGWSPSEATVALTTPIPAGDYTLAMVSYDEHSAKPVDQSDQVNEQWLSQLLDAEGAIVYQSGVSPDLPDDQDWLTFNTTATLTGDAVTMRVAHAAIGDNVNSIQANCASFTAVMVEPELGSIGDTVWFDTNGNGWRDGEEAGLEGVRVFLTGPGLEAALETTTDAAGHYRFEDLAAGSYDVTVDITTAPENSDLTTAGVRAVALGEGEDFLDADFGFTAGAVLASAGIGDQVWMDTNLNGIFDAGEGVLAGVTLSLYDTVAGTTQTTVTGASGQYLFAALSAGTYEVSVITTTAPESTALTTVGKYTITLSDGQMSLIADFGFAQALPATGFETADFGIAGLVLLLIGAAVLVLVRPGSKTPWHLVNADGVR